MNLLETSLLLCSVFSALTVSGVSSQGLDMSVEPAKPSLSGPILINCTADVLSKKIVTFSIFRGKEQILKFDPSSRPRIQWSDENLKQRFTFYKTLKKQTILSLELKNPRCTDQNIYKCELVVKNKEAKIVEKRVDFYVPKQGIQLNQNKATNCLNVDITCTGHAGNPPEHMGWFKKTPDDNEFTRIDPSYITANMKFHTENCSNTRVEQLVYKPTEEEQDLIVKCGFGDMAKEVTMRMPGQKPEDVTLMYKGTPEVGETLELNCTGKILSSAEYTVTIYKRTKMNSDFNKLMAGVIEEKLVPQDDCMSMLIKAVSYKPTQEDNGLELKCIVKADGETDEAMQVINIKGLFVAPSAIPPEDTPDEDKDGNNMDNGEDSDKDEDDTDEKMSTEVTSAPESEPEGDGKDEEDKEEMEKEEKPDNTENGANTGTSKSEDNSSSMLRGYCLLVLTAALIVMV